MAEHLFHLKASWPGLRNDVGTIAVGNLKTEVSVPVELSGPGVGANPEDMIIGAASTCYIITLAAMMDRSKLEKEDLTMDSIGVVDVTNGITTFKKIIHKPHIVLKSDATEKDEALALKLADKAEVSCMVTRALKGNVSVEVEAIITKSIN
ncbi:SACOL1771 family peroxiredoxin [Filibacter tadaridae]|uniref:OsmC-like protein n=1 Tax=Filibacter tadaridae TaxID=2483811 RepID=A0A3P5XT23_9BACL|nr:SACOL1771 family peroxiredoxin [Filibacter tadaridae]VDC33529.1 OsmC-like protein [Filibacter tadaridae]